MRKTNLDHLQRPGFHVPLTLRYTPHVVINEESFGLDLEDETVSHLTYASDKLGNRFGEQVVEEVHGLDDNFVRIGGRIGSTLRGRGCCPGCRLRGSIRGLGVLGRDMGACCRGARRLEGACIL
jgi:hypothetical protein